MTLDKNERACNLGHCAANFSGFSALIRHSRSCRVKQLFFSSQPSRVWTALSTVWPFTALPGRHVLKAAVSGRRWGTLLAVLGSQNWATAQHGRPPFPCAQRRESAWPNPKSRSHLRRTCRYPGEYVPYSGSSIYPAVRRPVRCLLCDLLAFIAVVGWVGGWGGGGL